ncbi:MAG: DUF2027 domain-containing protein [Clostridium sp.]|nr:DUF2027 domain-containing protein [Clostridium sp.]
MIKIGDIVRFLNSTGGGRVTRIDGQIAYVTDEDGFDVPVLTRECVVVAEASSDAARISATMPAAPAVSAKTPAPVTAPAPRQVEEPLEIEETEGGDTMNVVLGFEPNDPKQLSTTTFDLYLVNDSNYYLQFVLSTRESDSDLWTLRASGVVEPNIQLFLGELTRDKLGEIERISFQCVPYKSGRDYALKAPVAYEAPFDNTKFFKLHSFRANPYFEKDVISVDIVVDDKVAGVKPKPDPRELEREMKRKKTSDMRPLRQPVRKRTERRDTSRRNGDLIEVDLHIDELLDSTAGLSPADMLNYQIETFRRVMDQNRGNHGQRIVFIHGKGEGVLRNALMKELNHRYKGNDVQDASFREYGFGATQVTIR